MPAFFEKPLSALTSTWRIFYEESANLNSRDERTDCEELRGYGGSRMYRHGQETLAVSTETQGYMRLGRIPGLAPKTGSLLVFPDALLDTVADAIRARYRRTYTPEQLEELRRRLRRAQGHDLIPTQADITALKPTIPPGDEELGSP
jgi:hypothetical protein